MSLSEKFKDIINRIIGAKFSRKTPKSSLCLDLGCGDSKREDCIGVDAIDFDCVDYVCDFDKDPLPFENSSVDEVFIISVLEHLEDWISFLEEVHRVCRDGAIIHIQVPYYQHKDA